MKNKLTFLSSINISLKLKLIIVFSLVYTSSMSLFIYLDLKGVHQMMEVEMINTSISFSEMVSAATESALSYNNPAIIESYLKTAVNLPYVSTIGIFDASLNILNSIGKEQIDEIHLQSLLDEWKTTNDHITIKEIGTPPRDLLHKAGHAFAVLIPVFSEGVLSRFVYLETFSKELNLKMNRLGSRWILFTAVALIIGAVAAVVVAWGVTRELQKLVRGAREITTGNLEKRVKISSSNELRVLGDAFNTMAIHLKVSRDKLEEKVKKRTTELLESNARFEALFNGITDMLCVVDDKYNLVMGNHSAMTLFNNINYSQSDRKCFSSMCGKDNICPKCPVRTTFQTQKPSFTEVSIFDEKIDLYTYPILNSDNQVEAVIKFGKIVTKEKKLERQLIQSEKLASLGEMASRIAHEVRNPLAGIKSGAQLVQKQAKLNPELSEVLTMITGETDRLEEVVTDFLAFAKPRHPVLKKNDVHTLIEKTLAVFADVSQQHNSTIRLSFAGNLPKVITDSTQIEQVLLNIILNAIQAMPDGGFVDISTSISINGDSVAVEIKDTGIGIDADIIGKIFDPFFTTRAQGTGLGLSICKQIVTACGAELHVSSKTGEGTTFQLDLPSELEVSP